MYSNRLVAVAVVTYDEKIGVILYSAGRMVLLARAQAPPADDLTTIDSDGAAHIKRIVPVPKTISAEAYALIVSGKRWTPEPGTKQAADFAEKLHATFPVEIAETTLAGVACKVVVPKRAAPHKERSAEIPLIQTIETMLNKFECGKLTRHKLALSLAALAAVAQQGLRRKAAVP